MMAQVRLEQVRPYGVNFGDRVVALFRFNGGKLKTSLYVSRDLGIGSGDPVEVVIPPFSFSSRFLVDEVTRIYVPRAYVDVIPREFWAYVWRHNGVWIVEQAVGQTSLDLFNFEAMRIMDRIPMYRSPRYGRGVGYCSRCALAFPLSFFGRCPFCGNILRTGPR